MKLMSRPGLSGVRGAVPRRGVAVRAQRQEPGDSEALLAIGTTVAKATVDVLVDRLEDIAAEVSRVRAERINILKRFPSSPVQAATDLIQDIRSRPLPSPEDIATGLSSTVDAIQLNIDAEMSTSAKKEEKANENLIPQAPDAQEVLDELRADVAAARSLTRKLSEAKAE
eukprot:jgi/Ulvmu1/9031/UM005_0123.1